MKRPLLTTLLLMPLMLMSAELDCDNASSTLEINECAALRLDEAEAEMRRYLENSITQHSDDLPLVSAIREAQKAWSAYREAHCDAVYSLWREGTLRGVMNLDCKSELTRQRTRELWQHFLTFMDNSAPVLPEPSNSR